MSPFATHVRYFIVRLVGSKIRLSVPRTKTSIPAVVATAAGSPRILPPTENSGR
jgi:hypothetical protein